MRHNTDFITLEPTPQGVTPIHDEGYSLKPMPLRRKRKVNMLNRVEHFANIVWKVSMTIYACFALVCAGIVVYRIAYDIHTLISYIV